MLLSKKGTEMRAKLKPDAEQPILVETVREKEIVRWSKIAVVVALVTFLFIVLSTIFDLRKLLDLSQGYFVSVSLVCAAAMLQIAAAWLNLRAIQKLNVMRSVHNVENRISSQSLPKDDPLAVGCRVRVKAYLTPQEKEAGPGWSPEMDSYLGRESEIKAVNEYGRFILRDFPNRQFLKEWLESSNR